MADSESVVDGATVTPANPPLSSDELDRQIEQAKQAQDALKRQQEAGKARGTDAADTEKDGEKGKKANTPADGDDLELSVRRQYLTDLREEAKKHRLEKEQIGKEISSLQKVIAEHFGVEDTQALKEKLEEAKKAKEREEEGRLSKMELLERRAQKAERQLEEERIKYEGDRKKLTDERDRTIIRNSLIQAAVRHDVANPKQLLKLLENEFYVDPDKLVPLYRAEDGIMNLEDRVRAFLDEPENWNLVSSKIQIGAGSKGSSMSGSKGRIYKKSELRKMRQNDPKGYAAIQGDLQLAYKENRVKDD